MSDMSHMPIPLERSYCFRSIVRPVEAMDLYGQHVSSSKRLAVRPYHG